MTIPIFSNHILYVKYYVVIKNNVSRYRQVVKNLVRFCNVKSNAMYEIHSQRSEAEWN